jgi:hypothetical protein
MPNIERPSFSALAEAPYAGPIVELVDRIVQPPAEQAKTIGVDSDRWVEERTRDGFTKTDYFFNTSQKSPKFGLMFSAKSGYMGISQDERRILDEEAKEGLDVVFYQCLSSFPGGLDIKAGIGLGAYETVSYWSGVMKALEQGGYDTRAIIVDEASALKNGSTLGIEPGTADATVQALQSYLDVNNVSDRVLIRPIADMFDSSHARALNNVDVAAIRTEKTDQLEGAIASGEQTVATSRVRLLLGQLTIAGAQEVGLYPYLNETGTLPENIGLDQLPQSVIRHIVSQVVDFDTHMTLRSYLIEDAVKNGTDLPELGLPGRHVMRAGTTKSTSRPSVRLIPNGRDRRKQIVQLPYAIPTYNADGTIEGLARNVDLKSGRYGNAYNSYNRISASDGRPLALVAPSNSN